MQLSNTANSELTANTVEKNTSFCYLVFTYLNSKYHTLEPSKPVDNPLFNFKYPQSIKTKLFFCLVLLTLIPHTAFHAGVAFTFVCWSGHTHTQMHTHTVSGLVSWILSYDSSCSLCFCYGTLLKCTVDPFSSCTLPMCHAALMHD